MGLAGAFEPNWDLGGVPLSQRTAGGDLGNFLTSPFGVVLLLLMGLASSALIAPSRTRSGLRFVWGAGVMRCREVGSLAARRVPGPPGRGGKQALSAEETRHRGAVVLRKACLRQGPPLRAGDWVTSVPRAEVLRPRHGSIERLVGHFAIPRAGDGAAAARACTWIFRGAGESDGVGACSRGIEDRPNPTARGLVPGSRGWSSRPPQCPVVAENRLITTIPARISPMPMIAGQSSRCPNTTSPMIAMNTMPRPDHNA